MTALPDLPPEVIKRFWRSIDIRELEPGECWEWTKCRSVHGYGRLRVRDVSGERHDIRAHRLSYLLAGGALNNRDQVLHSCHNPLCCNPAHLRVGTHADNMDDKVASGRASRCGKRLSFEKAREIRAEFEAGATKRELATKFGVHFTSIQAVVTGRSWTSANPQSGKRCLSDSDVASIRTAFASGTPSRSLATRFGVTTHYVTQLARGRYRRKAPGPITPARRTA